MELIKIRRTFKKAGSAVWFIDKIIKEFLNSKEGETLIQTHWFNESKQFFSVYRIAESKKFIRKLSFFTHDLFKFKILWSTRKIKSLFNLKSKVNM